MRDGLLLYLIVGELLCFALLLGPVAVRAIERRFDEHNKPPSNWAYYVAASLTVLLWPFIALMVFFAASRQPPPKP